VVDVSELNPSVHPVSVARAELSRALARFRREGAAAAPVIFGSHRKPEAVVLPFEAYAELTAELRRRRGAAEAAGSVLAEVPGELSADFKADLERSIDGTISDKEFLARTLARHRRRQRE
jgi:PHD/YefM family antitoxin component YafN of YafNO toxin-antitoxin module